MQHKHLTQAELELMAQVNLHWFLRQTDEAVCNPPIVFDTDSLVPLWTSWHKHLHLFAYVGKPTKTSPGWADQDSRDKFGIRKHMLKEMDTQVQAGWAQAKLRDDDRRLAAQKVVEDWEAKRASFEYKTDGGKHDKGLSVYQVGKGVKDAMEEGAVITVKKCKIAYFAVLRIENVDRLGISPG
ncbi:hypothetical protein WJX77_010175 [Trebouxia sp. C0004]